MQRLRASRGLASMRQPRADAQLVAPRLRLPPVAPPPRRDEHAPDATPPRDSERPRAARRNYSEYSSEETLRPSPVRTVHGCGDEADPLVVDAATTESSGTPFAPLSAAVDGDREEGASSTAPPLVLQAPPSPIWALTAFPWAEDRQNVQGADRMRLYVLTLLVSAVVLVDYATAIVLCFLWWSSRVSVISLAYGVLACWMLVVRPIVPPKDLREYAASDPPPCALCGVLRVMSSCHVAW